MVDEAVEVAEPTALGPSTKSLASPYAGLADAVVDSDALDDEYAKMNSNSMSIC